MAEQRPWWERALAFSERRRLKSLVNRGFAIARLEPEFESLSDEALAAKTPEFMQRYENGETLDQLLPEAFAAVREAGKRTLQMRHFDVQMVGGIALHEGSVAEMLTGEGKTLVATLPMYLNALSGHNVHLVTTNDYLAKRDSEWMGPIYAALGMTVGSLWNMQRPSEKREAYAANITYGTNSEFGFDYLRDNMAFALDELAQRGHFFAIVDEADSILIDEARTPLIISGQPEEAAETYFQFARIATKMEDEVHFEFDEKMHTAHPTEEGVSLAERELGIENLYLAEHNQLINHLNQAIRAKALYHRDKEYVVMDSEVKIVDEHTGRVMEGRRWSEGLHQAVEAKEGVRPQQENVTVASITIQNYFRLYDKLAGMTGTAQTEAAELKEIYDLDVVQVPSNRPVQRLDLDDYIFRTEAGKLQAVINDISERHEKGQPVLVGTIAVEKSEELSNALGRKGITHEVLNAKNHEREAQIILDAGQRGAVTIATNMAGRGVDIKLTEEVKAVGGLYVLGTERHESRRIDNQLRGRAGRQGDPGESRFFLSAQDDLVRIFAGDRMERIMDRFHKEPEDVPLHASILSRQIKGAQKRVEERNFVMRKNVLKYDDVLNTQRHVIYDSRREILEGADIKERVLNWVREEIEAPVNVHTPGPYPEDWEFEEMVKAVGGIFPVRDIDLDWNELKEREDVDRETIIDELQQHAVKYYEAREERVGADVMRNVERLVFLQVLDTRWREHLDNMDYLRDGIGLRGLAQKDPLNEYRAEGYLMFQELMANIRTEAVQLLMHVEVDPTAFQEAPTRSQVRSGEASLDGVTGDSGQAPGEDTPGTPPPAPRRPGNSWATTGQLNYSAPSATPSALDELKQERGLAPASQTSTVTQRQSEKVGRNEPCPCGSGKKYKNCHGGA